MLNNLPIGEIENVLSKFQKDFDESESGKSIRESIIEIDKLLDIDSIDSLSIDELINLRWKLSRYSEPIGEKIFFHETRTDFSYIWRKFQLASDWIPTKANLNSAIGKSKVTNSEIDAILTEKYIGEQLYSMFHRRQADYLLMKIESISRYMKTIDHRIFELRRQLQIPQVENG